MSEDKPEDIKFISDLMDLMAAHGLGKLEVERNFSQDDSISVRISSLNNSVVSEGGYIPYPPTLVGGAGYIPGSAGAPAGALVGEPSFAGGNVGADSDSSLAASDLAASENNILSPMVGTVYLCPEPGSDFFIKIGDQVSKGQTLLIVEAMKTMNYVSSPRDGIVKNIYVSDAQPVEFNTPLVEVV